MARTLVTLDPVPMYRAVILYSYSGAHSLPLNPYTDANGHTRAYHEATVYGPYEKPSSARLMITKQDGYTSFGYNNHFENGHIFPVAEVYSFIEEMTPTWIPYESEK